MANDYGTGVSYVYDDEGYNYDLLIYQKEKPPLDSELNLSQQLTVRQRQRQLSYLPSGWISMYPAYTGGALSNSFYTQNPSNAKPEYALVNGDVIHVTYTDTDIDNTNLVDLKAPPTSGNVVNGVILEVWRALISPSDTANKPDSETVIDSLNCIYMYDTNNGWICGDNGLLIGTQNSGETWDILPIDTKRKLNGIFFISSVIGWVCGNNGIIARTSSAGQRWTLLTTDNPENLNSIHAASQLLAWAVGNSGTILKTINGISWSPISSGITYDFNKIHFHDNLVGWIAGNHGTILKSTNGGSSWFSVNSGTTENLNSIYFYDLNYGFAVGANGTILRSSDGGNSWVSQSGNIYTGTEYTTTSVNLKDITMVPTLDREVIDEEVCSQLVGGGTSFVTHFKPVTKGDGNGTVTNDPRDVTVTVGGVEVLVNSVNGTTGTVLLNEAPAIGQTVKVTYFYKEASAVFQGKAWIVGEGGSIFYTEDIGAQWVQQNSDTLYDLNSVDFTTQEIGWTCGINSVIKKTIDSGSNWLSQQSDIFVRKVSRVFYGGNILSQVYLSEDIIHPDANIETTKRVQLQYKIRVFSGADPASNPEAGLSLGIKGEGPNASGSYSYENMGSINGDFGCWRAKCSNTVDGYVYAIPMFFVNRRNTSAYNPESNPNGQHLKNTAFVRPDLLTAAQVTTSDILDVRRKLNIPSESEFLVNFDALMANNLKTHFYRASDGGDRYGVELLQTDRVGGLSSDGGRAIPVNLSAVMAGNLSSEVTFETNSIDVTVTFTVPTEQTLGSVEGIYHPQASYYKAVYVAPLSSFDDQAIPGYFSGVGTDTVKFIFNSNAATKTDDPLIMYYRISAVWVKPNSGSLTYTPSAPQLVRNFSGSGSPPFFYQGVLDTVNSRTFENWDSDIPGYVNYSLVYPMVDSTDTIQQTRASAVELHFYIRVNSTNSPSTTSLIINQSIYKNNDNSDVPYEIYSVRKINNITSGFSHRVSDIVFGSNTIEITPVAGFEFIQGSLLEIIASVKSDLGELRVRNGASVNFNPFLKKIYSFTRSYIVSSTPVTTTFDITLPDTIILGCSTIEAASDLNQHVCWVSNSIINITVTGFGTDTITVVAPGWTSGEITIQLLVQQTQLPYMADEGNNDGLLIGYNYIPPQTQANLPSTLIIEPVITPSTMYVSNIGSGGGVTGVPYLTALLHLSINDSSIESDSIFHNKNPFLFSNFKLDTGFVQLPVLIPGSFAGKVTLSGYSLDRSNRSYYSTLSKEVVFISESLQLPVSRKIFYPIIARINDRNNPKFMHGEYVLVIFSRSDLNGMENKTGYYPAGNCSISIYRLPNRPLSRIP